MMKHIAPYLIILCISVTSFCACKDQGGKAVEFLDIDSAGVELPDTTHYGRCGLGTTMHTLELITDTGDTLYFTFNEEEEAQEVKGGLLAGDRMAVIAFNDSDEYMTATKIINLTTLLGRWTSIDKNFEIREDGTVNSTIQAETTPWTSWRIHNGRLLLNCDTFDINELGVDTLGLENDRGIFLYKRQK